jgi:hypothetical protein
MKDKNQDSLFHLVYPTSKFMVCAREIVSPVLRAMLLEGGRDVVDAWLNIT